MTPNHEDADRPAGGAKPRRRTSPIPAAAAGMALPWLMLLWFLLLIIVAVSLVTGAVTAAIISGALEGIVTVAALTLARTFGQATTLARRPLPRPLPRTTRSEVDFLTRLARAAGIAPARTYGESPDTKHEG